MASTLSTSRNNSPNANRRTRTRRDGSSPHGGDYRSVGASPVHGSGGVSPFLRSGVGSPAYGDVSSPVDGSIGSPLGGVAGEAAALRHENQELRSRLQELEHDLHIEEDLVGTLRRRLNNSERDRLDAAAKANEELSRLDCELTRTRAQVEKGEAVRQNLEVEIVSQRKTLTQEKRAHAESQNSHSEASANMKEQIRELGENVAQLLCELEEAKSASLEESSQLRQQIEEKERALSAGRMERDVLEAEKGRVEAALEQQERTVNELEDRVRELEDEKRVEMESVRKEKGQKNLMKEREESTRIELEMTVQRVKQLESAIEIERAAHLESKFNSEVVQLRTRDLETSLKAEKTAHTEAQETIKMLNKQIQDLQVAFAEERQVSAESKNKLETAEKEYALLSEKLSEELSEKKNIIKQLSTQLQQHQNNFSDIKQELNKAKTRQVYLEETYGGSMRELELLVNTFSLHSDSSNKQTKPQSKKREGIENKSSPASITESLKTTLTHYRRQVDQSSNEVERLKKETEKFSKELEACKNQIWTKDKVLQDTQQAVTRTGKELRRVQVEGAGLEGRLQEAERDVRELSAELKRERNQHRELSEQLVKLASKYKADEKDKNDFAQQLYQQLLRGRFVPRASGGGATQIHHRQGTKGGTSTVEVGSLSALNWTDVTALIHEQVALLINTVNRAEQKIEYMEGTLASKEVTIGQMQRSHDEMLSRIAHVTEGQAVSWQQQKRDLEEHYGHLLAELHTRQKKTQAMSDQAWEKSRSLSLVQQSLETECAEVKQQLQRRETEVTSLLCACGMLAGALRPLMSRCESLSRQRAVLTQQFEAFLALKRKVALLVNAIKLDVAEDKNGVSRPRLSAVLRFRVAAVAVIAANRLLRCRNHSTTLTVDTSLRCNIPLRLDLNTSSQKGVGRHENADPLSWLQSDELLSLVTDSMADLQNVIHGQKQGGFRDSQSLMDVTRRCFSSLTTQLHIGGSASTNQNATLRYAASSLVRQLDHGLCHVLARCTNHSGFADITASQNLSTELQHSIMSFTKRLHSVEVERRDLRSEVKLLRTQCQTQQDSLQQQEENTVTRDQYQQVCSELDAALRREVRAQTLLREQGAQLRDLGDLNSSIEAQKEVQLTDVVQNLSETRAELKQRESAVRQLNTQLQRLEQDKVALQTKVEDAEHALRTAMRDRDTLTTYIHNVQNALDATLVGVSGTLDLSPLLARDILPVEMSKLGPQVLACQALVAAFVGAQQKLNTRALSLTQEIDQYKQHIHRLKHEFTQAFKYKGNDFPGAEDTFSASLAQKNQSFAPLIEEQDSMYISPPLASERQNRDVVFASPTPARNLFS